MYWIGLQLPRPEKIFILRRGSRTFSIVLSNFEDIEQKRSSYIDFFILLLHACTLRPQEKPSYAYTPRNICVRSPNRVKNLFVVLSVAMKIEKLKS